MRMRVFQPKANIPMMRETQQHLALQLRMAVEALVTAPTPETYNALSKILTALAKCGMQGEAIDLATSTMLDICDRYERVQKVGVSDQEAEWLRVAAARIDDHLHLVPVNKLKQAIAEVELFCHSVGA